MHPRDVQILNLTRKIEKLQDRLKEPLTAARRQATIQLLAQLMAQQAALIQNCF